MHELGHGLGFSGYADVDTGDNACWTDTPGHGCFFHPPRIYDRFTEDGAGKPLLDYANPSIELGNALTGQVGGEGISLHGEGGRVVLTTSEGRQQEVDLTATGKREQPKEENDEHAHEAP